MYTEEKIIAPRIVQPSRRSIATMIAVLLVCMGIAGVAGFELGRSIDCESSENQLSDYFSQDSGEEGSVIEPDVFAEPELDEASGPADEELPVDEPTTAGENGRKGTRDGDEVPAAEPQTVSEREPVSGEQAPEDSGPSKGSSADTAEQYAGGVRPLLLGAFRLGQQDGSEGVPCSFDVTLKGSRQELVTGSIWIAVDGRRNGKPVRLRLRDLTKERTTFVPMRFEDRQAVDVTFIVPDDFTPIRVVVEAKPLQTDDYKAVTQTFDWTLPTN